MSQGSASHPSPARLGGPSDGAGTPSAHADTAAGLPAATATAPPSEPEAALAVMLEKMSAYAEGEAEVSIEDYRLLKAMNDAAAERYRDMSEYSAGLVTLAEKLHTKCDAMMPQLAQIDALEAQVGELESAVQQLDGYTRRLEAKFSALRGSG